MTQVKAFNSNWEFQCNNNMYYFHNLYELLGINKDSPKTIQFIIYMVGVYEIVQIITFDIFTSYAYEDIVLNYLMFYV